MALDLDAAYTAFADALNARQGTSLTALDVANWYGETGVDDMGAFARVDLAVRQLLGTPLYNRAEGAARLTLVAERVLNLLKLPESLGRELRYVDAIIAGQAA